MGFLESHDLLNDHVAWRQSCLDDKYINLPVTDLYSDYSTYPANNYVSFLHPIKFFSMSYTKLLKIYDCSKYIGTKHIKPKHSLVCQGLQNENK